MSIIKDFCMKEKNVVLITGTSSGFGLLLSKRLSVNKNFIVCATMRNMLKKNVLIQEVKKIGGEVDIFELDVTNNFTIDLAIKNIIEKYKKIDILINNAGIALGGFFEDIEEEEFRKIFDTNFFGHLNVIKKALPFIPRNNGSKIINISSIAGLISYPGLSAYNSSKYAIDGFSESLRHELYDLGIYVYLVEPGSFDTNIFLDNLILAKNSCSSEFNIKIKKMLDRIKNTKRENPIKVVEVIEKILNKHTKHFRYIVGNTARISFFLKKILPFFIFERIVRFFSYKK